MARNPLVKSVCKWGIFSLRALEMTKRRVWEDKEINVVVIGIWKIEFLFETRFFVLKIMKKYQYFTNIISKSYIEKVIKNRYNYAILKIFREIKK